MFSAVEIISKIESGQLTALEVTQACLDAIEATDSKIMAWEYYKPRGSDKALT